MQIESVGDSSLSELRRKAGSALGSFPKALDGFGVTLWMLVAAAVAAALMFGQLLCRRARQ